MDIVSRNGETCTREGVLYNCIRKCVVRIISLSIAPCGCTIVARSNVTPHARQVFWQLMGFIHQWCTDITNVPGKLVKRRGVLVRA